MCVCVCLCYVSACVSVRVFVLVRVCVGGAFCPCGVGLFSPMRFPCVLKGRPRLKGCPGPDVASPFPGIRDPANGKGERRVWYPFHCRGPRRFLARRGLRTRFMNSDSLSARYNSLDYKTVQARAGNRGHDTMQGKRPRFLRIRLKLVSICGAGRTCVASLTAH